MSKLNSCKCSLFQKFVGSKADLIKKFNKTNFHFWKSIIEQNFGASDSATDSSTLSNPADAQNVSCLGLCGKDICLKCYA